MSERIDRLLSLEPTGRECAVEIRGETFPFRLTLGGEQACRLTGVNPVPALGRLLARQARLTGAVVKAGVAAGDGLSAFRRLATRRYDTREKGGGWIELLEDGEVVGTTQSKDEAAAHRAKEDAMLISERLAGYESMQAIEAALFETLHADAEIFDDILLVLLWGLKSGEPDLTLADLRAILEDPADLWSAYAQARPVIEHYAAMYRVPGQEKVSTNGQHKDDQADDRSADDRSADDPAGN